MRAPNRRAFAWRRKRPSSTAQIDSAMAADVCRCRRPSSRIRAAVGRRRQSPRLEAAMLPVPTTANMRAFLQRLLTQGDREAASPPRRRFPGAGQRRGLALERLPASRCGTAAPGGRALEPTQAATAFGAVAPIGGVHGDCRRSGVRQGVQTQFDPCLAGGLEHDLVRAGTDR